MIVKAIQICARMYSRNNPVTMLSDVCFSKSLFGFINSIMRNII